MIISVMDERRAVDIVYLLFSKSFDTVPHKILLETLLKHGLDGQTMRWIINELNGHAQRAVISDMMFSRRPLLSDIPHGSMLGPDLFHMFIIIWMMGKSAPLASSASLHMT